MVVGAFESLKRYNRDMAISTSNYKTLSISERLQLVEDIWDSIAEEGLQGIRLAPEDAAELQRRLTAHQTDPASSIAWERVRMALFNKQN